MSQAAGFVQAPEPATGQPVLEVVELTKNYGRMNAMKDVSFQLFPGEVVGVVGDNGAGKSTLLNTLSGAQPPTSGKIILDGQEVHFRDAHMAREMGIETVYQDLALAWDLPAWANLYLGREITKRGPLGWLGWLDKGKMISGAEEAASSTKIRIKSIKAKCGALSGGQRQGVAVARAVAWGSKVLLMDEPTAALGVEQQHQVGELIKNVSAQGTPVIVVSHNLPQVEAITHRILVMYHGRIVKNLDTAKTTTEEIVTWITGAGLVQGLTPRGGGSEQS